MEAAADGAPSWPSSPMPAARARTGNEEAENSGPRTRPAASAKVGAPGRLSSSPDSPRSWSATAGRER